MGCLQKGGHPSPPLGRRRQRAGKPAHPPGDVPMVEAPGVRLRPEGPRGCPLLEPRARSDDPPPPPLPCPGGWRPGPFLATPGKGSPTPGGQKKGAGWALPDTPPPPEGRGSRNRRTPVGAFRKAEGTPSPPPRHRRSPGRGGGSNLAPGSRADPTPRGGGQPWGPKETAGSLPVDC